MSKQIEIIYDPSYEGLPICTDPKMGYGCRSDILQAQYELFRYMLYRHYSVLFLRFDVRFPRSTRIEDLEGEDPTTIFCGFLTYFKKKLHRKNRPVHSEYLWVGERFSSFMPHFHVLMLSDADVMKTCYGYLLEAQRLWVSTLNKRGIFDTEGLINFCGEGEGESAEWDYPAPNGTVMYRNAAKDRGVTRNCFYRGSYITKPDSKYRRGKYSNTWSRSEFPFAPAEWQLPILKDIRYCIQNS